MATRESIINRIEKRTDGHWHIKGLSKRFVLVKGKFCNCARVVWEHEKKTEIPGRLRKICRDEKCVNPEHHYIP